MINVEALVTYTRANLGLAKR